MLSILLILLDFALCTIGARPPMKSNSNLKIRVNCDIISGFPSWIPSFRYQICGLFFPMDSRLLTGESTIFD